MAQTEFKHFIFKFISGSCFNVVSSVSLKQYFSVLFWSLFLENLSILYLQFKRYGYGFYLIVWVYFEVYFLTFQYYLIRFYFEVLFTDLSILSHRFKSYGYCFCWVYFFFKKKKYYLVIQNESKGIFTYLVTDAHGLITHRRSLLGERHIIAKITRKYPSDNWLII